MSDSSEPVRSALTPPKPISRELVWTRAATGKLPPEGDPGAYLLLLAGGTYALGRRRTLRRADTRNGPLFVRASAVGLVAETAFVDLHSPTLPIDGVVWWARIEGPL